MRVSVSKAPIAASASIRIFGVDLDLDGISNQLGIQPSESHRKGDRSLTARSYSEDMWRIDSPYPKTVPLEVHLSWLRQALLPRYDFIRQLREKYEISSYCGISVDGTRCRLRISPDALKIFVELGITMDLTVIFVGDPESQSPLDAPELACGQSPGTTASFEVVGEPGNVREIARELNLLAPYAHQTEGPEALSKAKQSASWSVVAPLLGDDSLDAQLMWLASELSPYLSFLRSVTSSVVPLVRCAVRNQRDINDQSFSPEGLSFLTSLGIPLEFNASLIAGE